MSAISFQCYACQQVLQVAGDKAGRRAKCGKCGTLLTIPIASTVLEPPPPATQAPMPSPDVGPAADLPLTFATDNRVTEITSSTRPTVSEFPATAVPFGAVTAAAPPSAAPPTGPWSDFAGDAAAAEAAAEAAEAARPRPAQWDKVHLGLLLVGIAACVGVGAFALM